MGSIKYRKPQDRIVLGNIRETFHEIMEELGGRDAFGISEQRLRTAVIKELIDLATNNAPRQEWKAAVLSSLPLRSVG